VSSNQDRCGFLVVAASGEQIDKAKEMIKKLQFAFRSENFENPALQKHYASVEAMALDRDSLDEPTDFTREFGLWNSVLIALHSPLWDCDIGNTHTFISEHV